MSIVVAGGVFKVMSKGLGYCIGGLRVAVVIGAISVLTGCSTVSSAYTGTTDTVGGWFGMKPSPKGEETKPAPVGPVAAPDAVIPVGLPQGLIGVNSHPPYVSSSSPSVAQAAPPAASVMLAAPSSSKPPVATPQPPAAQAAKPSVSASNSTAAPAPSSTAAPTATATLSLTPEAATCLQAARGKPTLMVPFSANAVALDLMGQSALQKVLAVYKQHPNAAVMVLGNASGLGADNGPVSEKRARAVQAALVAAGVAPTAVCMAALADNRPLFAETTEQDKAANQRVDIALGF